MDMLIITIRTDKPEAEIGLYEGDKEIIYEKWQAHRQLAETIHKKIVEVLGGRKPNGIIVYKGPGSFTGLRIGVSVANALAYGMDIPVVASGGDAWISDGVHSIRPDGFGQAALPVYGLPATTTTPKK